MKTTTTEQSIRDSLPIPPYRFKYVITRQSPQIWRVDLLHPLQYNYKSEQITTVWGFIKDDKVYPPIDKTKPRRTPLCLLSDIPDELQYTTIIPTKLSHHD